MTCKNCEHLPEGSFCQNLCDPCQTAITPSGALLLDNAYKKAVAAGERPTSARADMEARTADIALLEHHMERMSPNGAFYLKAQQTIEAIRTGARRYDYQIKPIGRVA